MIENLLLVFPLPHAIIEKNTISRCAVINRYNRTKWACYTANVCMSIISNLPPVLFLTFRNLYGISYSLLGLLVLMNFCTQLTVDLIFSFFSHKFNIPKTVKLTPVLTLVGFLIFALWPMLLPGSAYVGLAIGTVVFSASSGLMEVLLSPVVAAIPAENPEREMSKLHSIYAWGVVGVVILSTLFLLAFGGENWFWLPLLFTLVPLTSFLLFSGAEIPPMETPERVSRVLEFMKNKTLWLCIAGIFLGGAAELVMAQWSSSYLEQALGIPKVLGDIFGVALFSMTLGLGRSLYAKFGKNIGNVLFWGAVCATGCYLLAALSSAPVLGLLACAATGLCVSMLWPGSLVVSTDLIPSGGVFIYAMMAAGGDLGASVAPQLVGIITDAAIETPALSALAQQLQLSPDQFGMKLGMLVGALFPMAAIFVYGRLRRKAKP